MSSRDADGNEIKDGFRKRKVRPKGWYKAAIKSGEIRDLDGPDPDEGRDYSGAVVVQPPTATLTGDGA